MKTLARKWFIFIVSFSLVFGFFYGISAFVNLELNFKNWSESSRSIVGITGGISSLIFSIIVIISNED